MPFMAAWRRRPPPARPTGRRRPRPPGPGRRRADDPVGQVGAVLEDEPDDRHQHQQQREQREEPVVGEQGGVAAGLVVAVLLDHGERKGQPAVALLEVVEGLHQPLDRFHGLLVPTRYFDTPPRPRSRSRWPTPPPTSTRPPSGRRSGATTRSSRTPTCGSCSPPTPTGARP